MRTILVGIVVSMRRKIQDVPPVPESTATIEALRARMKDASSPVLEAMEEAEKKEGWKVNRVNAPKDKPLRPELAAIVSRVFLEPEALVPLYEKLEGALKLGENRTEYGHILKALDEAEDCHRAAHRLLISAQVDKKQWELDNDLTLAVLRAEATKSLQAEKDKGIRSKAITEGDVLAKCMELFGDEWRAHEMQRERLKRTEDSIENLVEVWASRCRSLQTMLGKHRVG